jgi:hypothetical protein
VPRRPRTQAQSGNRRRQLREVEAERDQLRARLDATHRALVEQQAADLFADPSDLFHAASLDDMRREDGLIDPGKAQETIDRVLIEKPHWRRQEPEPEPEPGWPEVHQGPRGSPEPPAPSFGAQLKDSLRRRR